jgi:hypothetical protein
MLGSFVFYLDPEPLCQHLHAPVWVQLVPDEAQVAGSVGHPGDHHTACGGQQWDRKPFELGGGQKAIPRGQQEKCTIWSKQN